MVGGRFVIGDPFVGGMVGFVTIDGLGAQRSHIGRIFFPRWVYLNNFGAIALLLFRNIVLKQHLVSDGILEECITHGVVRIGVPVVIIG